MKYSLAMALFVALFAAAWLPRVVQLGAFVTPDEPRWLTRSANFLQALSAGALAQSYQREHPGVTVMWAGALGVWSLLPTYARQNPTQFDPDSGNLAEWLRTHSEITPLRMLVAGRWWIVLAITLLVPLSFLLLRRLVGASPALLATLWGAWEPFHIALSRLLHPDGLLSSLLFVALLALLCWLYHAPSRRLLLLSGVVLGLALLTKVSAVVLLPFGGALWLLERLRRRAPQREPLPGLPYMAAWGLAAAATFALLLPAMWVAPLATLRQMTSVAGYYVESGHGDGLYFLGNIARQPGPLFYPLHYLFRTTPLTLAGLLLAAGRWWYHRHAKEPSEAQRAVAALAVFSLCFALAISLSAKQSERYLLPAFLPLSVVAAWGWAGAAGAVARVAPRQQAAGRGLVMAVALFLHALPGWALAPYYLSYYDPLFGGGSRAAQLLSVGWGEGLEQVAAWLNQTPEAEQLQVVSWYDNGPFSYYFRGRAHPMMESWAPSRWCDTDAIVTYVNQWQRRLPDEVATRYLEGRVPDQRVVAHGIELARLYRMHGAPLPPSVGSERRADFGSRIRLSSVTLGQRRVAAGARVPLTLHLQSLAPMEQDLNVLVRLVNLAGEELWREEGWPWGAPTSRWPRCEVRADGHEIVIPADARPGIAKLLVSFYDPATLISLPPTVANQTHPLPGPEHTIALLQVGPPATLPRLDPAPHFGGVFVLAGADVGARVTAGSAAAIRLRWESLAATDRNYTLFIHLLNGADQLVAQRDQPPLGGFAPTSLWMEGDQLLDEIALLLPADLPEGRYTLRVGLYDASGARLPVTLAGQPAGDSVELATLTVTAPVR